MAYTNGDEIPRVQYVATAAQQIFAIPFPFDADGDIKVYRNDLLFVLGVNYVITGTNVELSAGATAGQIITIVRDTLVERSTDFPTSGPFNIVALNAEFDRLFQSMAEVAQEAERTLMLSPTDVQTTPFVLPDKAARLGRALQFNATTGAPEAGPTSAEITAAQGHATAAAASAATALTNAGIAITQAANASNSAAEAAASAADLAATFGTYLPVLSFVTPGNLTVAYSSRAGSYFRIGRLVFVSISLTTSTFTHTTASGNLTISLPIPAAAGVDSGLQLVFKSNAILTSADRTFIVPVAVGGGSVMTLRQHASTISGGTTTIAVANAPTGGAVTLVISGVYLVDP